MLGIYVSVPFCRSKCTYCNFASGVYPASEHARYIERVISELQAAPEWASQTGAVLPRQVDTIYLGGGTPSLLAPELIEQLFRAIRSEFDVAADAEITVECAPAQIAEPTLAAMVAAGVNRVSLGVQSFVDGEVRVSGRLHDCAAVLADIERLRAAGIRNLNVDLIAGLAGQTEASWQRSLQTLIAADAPHASVYMLEIDEDSRLGRELLAGGSRYRAGTVPPDETIASMYEEARSQLAAAGIEQYEISNFSRPGAASKHNLRYWERRPYLGVGVDASSMLRAQPGADAVPAVLRTSTTDNLAEYLKGAPLVETEWLGAARQHEEAWFLGLRLNRGVGYASLEKEFGAGLVGPARVVAQRLLEEGLIDGDQHRVQLTSRGRLLSNEVFARFLDLDTGAE
jgi:oxygen-independent coproporphyrinogen-3 oxidase